jgi:L-threonylcarbamoyladenylate synthase
MILDGGPCEVGIESTVLDLTTPTPTILRPGRVKAADLEPILGRVITREHALSTDTPAVSPGQADVHYAPATPTYRFETSQRGLIHPETDDGVPNGMVVLSPLVVFKKWGPIIAMPNLPDLYARHFYNVLRELDAQNLHAICIEIPPDEPKWSALRDRIRRASKPLPPTWPH